MFPEIEVEVVKHQQTIHDASQLYYIPGGGVYQHAVEEDETFVAGIVEMKVTPGTATGLLANGDVRLPIGLVFLGGQKIDSLLGQKFKVTFEPIAGEEAPE